MSERGTGVTREELAEVFSAKARGGETIIVAGAGTGLSAKRAEAGGADAVVVYNSGRYRMAGRGSLAGLMPYGDANRIVLEMTREIVTVVDTMPVIAWVCGTDPFRDMGRFLDELAGCGISGVQNFPRGARMRSPCRVSRPVSLGSRRPEACR